MKNIVQVELCYSACLIRGGAATTGGLVGWIDGSDLAGRVVQNNLVVLEGIETTASWGRIAGKVETTIFTNNYARILGAPNTAMTADKDGQPWLSPTPVSLSGVISSWDPGIWDFGDYTYLPKLKDMPGQQPDVPYSFKGKGTEASPYIIATAEDLQTLAAHVNDADMSYAGNFFSLAPYGGGDILDLEGEVIVPIGIPDDTNKSFCGTFDGSGHTITNLTMNGDDLPADHQGKLALFGRVAEGATIRNLHMEQVEIIGRDGDQEYTYIAALIGQAIGKIALTNCHIRNITIKTGMINGIGNKNSYTGGLIGRLDGNATIGEVSCKNTTIQGGSAGSESYTGGLVGRADSPKSITASAAENVTITSGNAPHIYTGGLVGYLFSTSTQEIATCFATGEIRTVIPAGQSGTTGGLIGFCRVEEGAETLVHDSYTQMRLFSSGTHAESSVTGGIAGVISNDPANPVENMILRNCYATGEIQDNWSGTGIVASGGIAGQNHSSTIQDNLVMLTKFNPSYVNTHRIAGERTTGSDLFLSNYAYVADRQLPISVAPDNEEGENWNGSFSQLLVSNWDKSVWTIDATNRVMPKLNCFTSQPDISNLLYRPTEYNVFIPAIEGVILYLTPGTYTVTEGDSFSFTLTIQDGYKGSQPVVKRNGLTLSAQTEVHPVYTYTIHNIRESIVFQIEGIIPDMDTSTDKWVQEGIKVYTQPDLLVMELPEASHALIYTFNGTLIKQEKFSAGTTRIYLPKGIYLVSVGKETYKVIIR